MTVKRFQHFLIIRIQNALALLQNRCTVCKLPDVADVVRVPFSFKIIEPLLFGIAETEHITERVKQPFRIACIIETVHLAGRSALHGRCGFPDRDAVIVLALTAAGINAGQPVNRFLQCDCAVGRAGLLSVPLLAHQTA